MSTLYYMCSVCIRTICKAAPKIEELMQAIDL